MTISRYYVSPWVQLWSLGGGRWTDTDPLTGARTAFGSLVLVHGTWLRDITGHYSETVKPSSSRGQARNTCITYAESPDVDPLGLHAAIAADNRIGAVPWTPDNLTATWGTLTAQQQTAVSSYMESVFTDPQWITPARSFYDIMSYFLHVQFGAQQLGVDYPDGPLTARWSAFSANQQIACSAFFAAFNLPAVTGNPTRREIINRIAQADYGVANPRMGGTQFGAWIP